MKHSPKNRTWPLFEGFEAPPLVPKHIIREEPIKYSVTIFFHNPPPPHRIAAQRPNTSGEVPGVWDRQSGCPKGRYRAVKHYRKTI
jgi:hypothetical protein